MAKKSSIIRPAKGEKHTQTIMAELIPAVTSLTADVTRNRPGQPTKRTQAIVDEICVRLQCGEALTMICADPAMPGYRTVMSWQNKDPDLKHRFNQAREDGAYVLDDIAELIARKHPEYASGDFRYDDLLVSVLAQRKRYANRGRFSEKQQIEVTDMTPQIVLPNLFGQLSQPVIDVTPTDPEKPDDEQ